MEFVALKSAVVNPSDTAVGLQKFCHALSVAAVLRHTQVQCFQSEVQQERVLWCR